MTFKQLTIIALAAFLGMASAGEFPLPWICMAITIVGIVIVFVIAGRHPDELQIPGATVMTAQEVEYADGLHTGYKGPGMEPMRH